MQCSLSALLVYRSPPSLPNVHRGILRLRRRPKLGPEEQLNPELRGDARHPRLQDRRARGASHAPREVDTWQQLSELSELVSGEVGGS